MCLDTADHGKCCCQKHLFSFTVTVQFTLISSSVSTSFHYLEWSVTFLICLANPCLSGLVWLLLLCWVLLQQRTLIQLKAPSYCGHWTVEFKILTLAHTTILSHLGKSNNPPFYLPLADICSPCKIIPTPQFPNFLRLKAHLFTTANNSCLDLPLCTPLGSPLPRSSVLWSHWLWSLTPVASAPSPEGLGTLSPFSNLCPRNLSKVNSSKRPSVTFQRAFMLLSWHNFIYVCVTSTYRFWSLTAWVWVLVMLLTSCVILGKWFNLLAFSALIYTMGIIVMLTA